MLYFSLQRSALDKTTGSMFVEGDRGTRTYLLFTWRNIGLHISDPNKISWLSYFIWYLFRKCFLIIDQQYFMVLCIEAYQNVWEKCYSCHWVQRAFFSLYCTFLSVLFYCTFLLYIPFLYCFLSVQTNRCLNEVWNFLKSVILRQGDGFY